MSAEERNLDIYFRILSGHQEQIRFADSKAAFMAALNTLLFGFMATNFASLKALYTTCSIMGVACWALFLVLAVYLLSALFSLGCIIVAVTSRFGELAPHSKVFFGHIARNYGKDYEKYVRESSAMTATDWARDLGTQIVEVSHIALAKHRRVRWAARALLVAGVFWLVSFVVLLVMTPPSPQKAFSPRTTVVATHTIEAQS